MIFGTDWGLIDYKEAWDKQEALLTDTVNLKSQILKRHLANEGNEFEDATLTPNYLIFCEHPHVYTLGKSGKPEHLLLDEKGLKEKNAAYYALLTAAVTLPITGLGQSAVSYPIPI